MRKKTLLLTTGRHPEKEGGAVNPSIVNTSTILFPTLDAYEAAGKGEPFYPIHYNDSSTDYSYGTGGGNTHFALQEALCALDGADRAFLCPSGLSAISVALLSFLSAGDHLLVPDSVYGPTRRFCLKDLGRYGIETTFYDPLIGEGIAALIKDNTRVVFVESPGSLTFEVQDIPAIANAAHAKNCLVMMDNSWATPLFFDALSHGVDVCIHAITKYIGGYSDLILGAITCRASHAEPLLHHYRNAGVMVNANDCYMALRGLRSMAVRLEKHQSQALELTSWLKTQKPIAKILYPADPDDTGHALWKRDFTGASGLFACVLDQHYPKEKIAAFIDNLKHFGIGSSWGGYESLMIHYNPAIHRSATQWKAQGSVIRIHAGLEDIDDLKEDLEAGLKRLVS